jgi:hypothetical protein
MQRFVKTAVSELLRRVVPAADRHSPEDRHQHRRHHSGDLELGGQGHCGLPGSETAAYTQPRCFRCDADHVSSGRLSPEEPHNLCSALGSFPQLTSFTHCTLTSCGWNNTLGAEPMRTRLFLAAALLTSPTYAGDEAQSKCAFMVTTMESYANERAQEEPKHAAVTRPARRG